MDLDWAELAQVTTVVGAGGGIAVAVLRWGWQVARRLARVADVIVGDPGADPPRPGVAARLARIEAEVSPNGGASMRDAISRIDARTERTDQRLDQHLDWHAGRGQAG